MLKGDSGAAIESGDKVGDDDDEEVNDGRSPRPTFGPKLRYARPLQTLKSSHTHTHPHPHQHGYDDFQQPSSQH